MKTFRFSRRALVVATSVAVAAVAAWVLLPNGEYRPIQPAERGTLQGGFAQFRSLPTGRPGLTKEREQELGGAPARRDAPGQNDEEEQPTLTGRNSETTSDTATDTTSTETTTTQTTDTGLTNTGLTDTRLTNTGETAVTTTPETVTTGTTP